MILWYHKFYFVISQNRICDIKISSLFVISQNRFFDITNSIYWYHKIDLVISKNPYDLVISHNRILISKIDLVI